MARHRPAGIRRDSSQHAALGPDDPRRRHRRHRHCRHDRPHSRLRPVAAREYSRARSEHHLRGEVQWREPGRGQRLHRTAATSQSDRGGRDGDREALASRWNRRHLAWGGRPPHADPRGVPRGTHEADGRARRHGELRERQFSRTARGPVLHRRRGVTSTQRRRAGTDAVPGAVWRVGARSDREAGAYRRGRVYGGGRGRQASVGGRVRPRTG